MASTTNRRSAELHGGVDLLHLLHQRFIDVQAAGGVDDEHVCHAALGLFERRARDVRRRDAVGRAPELRADLLRQPLELQDGGGPTHVRAHEQHALALALDEPARELRGRGGLAGALQAREQYDDRAAARAD